MALILRPSRAMPNRKYATIDAGELQSELAGSDRPVLVNALAREGFEERRIPGSISIPVGEALMLAPQVLDRDQRVVVYCASSRCTASPALAQKLVDLGFTNVADFAGGLDEWEAAGHPVETSRAPAAVG